MDTWSTQSTLVFCYTKHQIIYFTYTMGSNIFWFFYSMMYIRPQLPETFSFKLRENVSSLVTNN